MELNSGPRCPHMVHARCLADVPALTTALAALLREEFGRSGPEPRAVMLAGGSTPLAAYAQLAEHPPVAADSLHLLWSDDRHVPAESPRSNYGNLRPLLQALALPPGRVLRVHGELPLADAARRYDQDLATFLGRGGKIPLGLLGLGADGHTASLFTAEDVRSCAGTWAIPVHRPDGLDGISVTAALLKKVERLVFVVTGPEKRPMAGALLRQPPSIAAGLAVAGHRGVEIWTDPAAWPFPA